MEGFFEGGEGGAGRSPIWVVGIFSEGRTKMPERIAQKGDGEGCAMEIVHGASPS